MTYSNVSCAMYVIDKEQKMIEDVVFRIIYEKEAEQAALISQLIRKYFSECEELINYLESREADETILNICNNTKFINCK
jgi:DNA-directed RNA polymerase subunit L